MADPLTDYLKTVKTTDAVRAQAWDAVANAKDDADLTSRLRALPVANDVRAQLFELKPAAVTSQTPNPPADAGMTDEKWAALSPGGKARNMLQWGGNAIASMTGMGSAGGEAVDHPAATLATAAVEPLAAVAIPSKARAGLKFQSVMSAAKNQPIDISASGNAALRIQELADRGGSMPMAVRKFLVRITDPEKGSLNYEEARDFASNISRLSADEMNRLAPAVKRELGTLRVTLNQAVGDAAAAVGKGEEYASAMREYARRSQLDQVAGDVWTGAKRALPWATGAGLGSYVGKKAMDLLGSGQ